MTSPMFLPYLDFNTLIFMNYLITLVIVIFHIASFLVRLDNGYRIYVDIMPGEKRRQFRLLIWSVRSSSRMG